MIRKPPSGIIYSLGVLILLVLNQCVNNPAKIIESEIPSNGETTSRENDQKTIQSIEKTGHFYRVYYHGDYTERLEWLKNEHIRLAANKNAPTTGCSLFSCSNLSGDVFFGRNFDRENEMAVLGFYSAPGKYRSFAFSPFSEVNLKPLLNKQKIPAHEQQAFLTTLPFYATDGINEKGLAIGVAGVPARKTDPDKTGNPMFVLHFVREVLDNCASLKDVEDLVSGVTLYDKSINTISHHVMVVDPGGRWMVIDYPDGGLRIQTGNADPVWRTNHFPEGGKALNEAPDSYKRGRILEKALGSGYRPASLIETMNVLKKVSNETAWSVVYEPSSLRMLVSSSEDYQHLYQFGF